MTTSVPLHILFAMSALLLIADDLFSIYQNPGFVNPFFKKNERCICKRPFFGIFKIVLKFTNSVSAPHQISFFHQIDLRHFRS